MWMTWWRFIWVQYLCHTDLDIYLESTCMMLEATQRLVLVHAQLPCRLTPSVPSALLILCVVTQLHLLSRCAFRCLHKTHLFFLDVIFYAVYSKKSISSLKHKLFMGRSQLMVLFGHYYLFNFYIHCVGSLWVTALAGTTQVPCAVAEHLSLPESCIGMIHLLHSRCEAAAGAPCCTWAVNPSGCVTWKQAGS